MLPKDITSPVGSSAEALQEIADFMGIKRKIGSNQNVNQDADADSDEDMTDITEAMGAITMSGEPVLAQRKVGRNKVYLVKESDGPHTWQSESMCGPPQNADNVEIEEVPSRASNKKWIEGRKHQYKGIAYVVLPQDGAIVLGIGTYPPTTVSIQWRDEEPDTLAWRSDAIRVSSQFRVDQDIRNLLMSQYTNIDGYPMVIMANNQAGIMSGWSKARMRITKERLKIRRTQLVLREAPVDNQIYQAPKPPSWASITGPQGSGAALLGAPTAMNQFNTHPNPAATQPGAQNPAAQFNQYGTQSQGMVSQLPNEVALASNFGSGQTQRPSVASNDHYIHLETRMNNLEQMMTTGFQQVFSGFRQMQQLQYSQNQLQLTGNIPPQSMPASQPPMQVVQPSIQGTPQWPQQPSNDNHEQRSPTQQLSGGQMVLHGEGQNRQPTVQDVTADAFEGLGD